MNFVQHTLTLLACLNYWKEKNHPESGQESDSLLPPVVTLVVEKLLHIQSEL